jgi:SPP1 family predicted phage head-tail adaptor
MPDLRLRHRISLEQRSTSQDVAGQISNSWTNYRNCRAEVKDTTGREQATQGDTAEITTTTVRIRYPREGRFPLPTDRVIFRESNMRTRTLNIEAVINKSGTNDDILLLCREDD